MAIIDEEGYCKIMGRYKDMIIRGGENIYPTEIEYLLYKHPKVREIQVREFSIFFMSCNFCVTLTRLNSILNNPTRVDRL